MDKGNMYQYAADYFYMAYKAGEDLDKALDYLISIGTEMGVHYFSRLMREYQFYKEMRGNA